MTFLFALLLVHIELCCTLLNVTQMLVGIYWLEHILLQGNCRVLLSYEEYWFLSKSYLSICYRCWTLKVSLLVSLLVLFAAVLLHFPDVSPLCEKYAFSVAFSDLTPGWNISHNRCMFVVSRFSHVWILICLFSCVLEMKHLTYFNVDMISSKCE